MSIKILAFVTLLALVKADYPIWLTEIEEVAPNSVTRNDEQVYRLPESVVPIEYDVYIDLYFAEKTDRPYSYDGKTYIIIQAVEQNVRQIVLHANMDRINGVSLLSDDDLPFPLNTEEPFTVEQQYHFLKVNLGQTMEVGRNYTLMVDYTSTMNEGPMKRGIWRGWYNDENGNERIYAATHFQPYNARQAFPCWDEPLYKAVFKLHLTKPSQYTGTFSNTGIETVDINVGRSRDNFHPTPRMSSYLVTFLVSESFTVIAEDTSFTPPVRIIGRSNTVGLGDHALELSVRMTEFFDDYFQIPYSTLHPHLLNDHISSPDWASAGTENWGMVSYRELWLIIDPREVIMSSEHYAATLVSHELAHKWFGNLITCYWWSNTWINEGFASYFGYIATNEMFPSYELQEHFNSRYLQTTLAYDSGVSAEPMNHEVNTPAQVTGHFGTISYSKGAAFLRMTANIVTPETFRKACRYFLINNAYEPTNQYDLYDAFALAVEEDGTLNDYDNFDFSEYYRIWVNVPGYPILKVDVDRDAGEITLTQERYFLSSTATPSNQVYPIPITYSTKSNPTFTNLRPQMVMTTSSMKITVNVGEEWVMFNNLQHGYYRVDYDEKTWNLISEALLNEPDSIHYLNRAQVVDDVFSLMRSERMTYDFGFKILRFLRNEVNYHVWNPAISGYTWLRNRFRHIPERQAEFDSIILSYMEHAIETLGFEISTNETPTTSMTREIVLHFACMIGHQRCSEEGRNKFIAMRDRNEYVDGRLRRGVYVPGMRAGGEADFNFLYNRMVSSNIANDRLEMLRGLAATKDSALLTRYMGITLTQDVRSHDKVNSVNYALLGNQENAYTVLQFVKDNINAMRVAYVEDSPANPVQTVLSNLAGYLDEAGLVEYEDWLRATQSNSAQFSTTLSAINSARNNMLWGDRNVDIVIAAARDGATTAIVSSALLITAALFAIVA